MPRNFFIFFSLLGLENSTRFPNFDVRGWSTVRVLRRSLRPRSGKRKCPAQAPWRRWMGGGLDVLGPGEDKEHVQHLFCQGGETQTWRGFQEEKLEIWTKVGTFDRFHCFGIFWGANLRSLREYHFEIWRMPGEVRCMTNWQPAHNFVPTGGGRWKRWVWGEGRMDETGSVWG